MVTFMCIFSSCENTGCLFHPQMVEQDTDKRQAAFYTYLAVVFLIQSSHSIPPQNGIWTIYQTRQISNIYSGTDNEMHWTSFGLSYSPCPGLILSGTAPLCLQPPCECSGHGKLWQTHAKRLWTQCNHLSFWHSSVWLCIVPFTSVCA